MTDGVRRGVLPESLRRLPADLTAIVVYLALTMAVVFVPVINTTPLRVAFGLPFVLFVPGYALIAALFPEAGTDSAEDDERDDDDVAETNTSTTAESIIAREAAEGGIDGIERVALSFGTSIAIVPLVGLVLNFTPWGIRLVPIMLSLVGVTLALTAVAARRREELPPEYRFTVPYREWIDTARDELFNPDDRTDMALNVLLVFSVLLATASVGYAVAVPKQGEAFTEFYLLTENEDGELVADGYPQNFTAGEEQSLVVGIGNHEHESVSYTVVVAIQRVRVSNNSTTVLEQQRLRQFRTTLEDNETWRRSHTVAPTMVGEELRLTYLLYRGDSPAQPTTENAYRELHLWVNVSRQS